MTSTITAPTPGEKAAINALTELLGFDAPQLVEVPAEDGHGLLSLAFHRSGDMTVLIDDAPGGVVKVDRNALLEALSMDEKAAPKPPAKAKTNEEIERELEELPEGATVRLAEPLDIGGRHGIVHGEVATHITREDRYSGFSVPNGRGAGGKWWLMAENVRELGLTADDFTDEPRPEWLDAEVIRADLDGGRVFAVRDEDNDWLIYGGKCDGDYVVGYEAEDEFSDVTVVKP